MKDDYKENILDLVYSYTHLVCKRKDTKSVVTFRVDKQTKDSLNKLAGVLGTSSCRLGSELFIIALKDALVSFSKMSEGKSL